MVSEGESSAELKKSAAAADDDDEGEDDDDDEDDDAGEDINCCRQSEAGKFKTDWPR